MKTELITILSTLGYPVLLQGSLDPQEPYPDAFFTFWNNSSDDGPHYDNGPMTYVWSFDVNFYGTDPTLVNTALISAKALLKAQGWIVGGKGYDLTTDEPTTHTGRGITALFIERNTDGEDSGDDTQDAPADSNAQEELNNA